MEKPPTGGSPLGDVARPISVDQKGLAKLFGFSEPFLEQDRTTKRHGVPYHKAGRRVFYVVAEVESWLKSR